MPERVVDIFETVEIHQQQCDQPAIAARTFEGLGQPIEKHHAIGEIGQAVVHGLMLQRNDLVAAVGDVAQERHPVRKLSSVLDWHQLQVELELVAILPLRRRLGGKCLPRENVLQKRVEDRVMAIDDAECDRGFADDLLARPAVDGAEAVVDECDARPERLDRRRQDGDPLPRHANGAAEQAQLLALETLFGELAQ